MIRAKMAGMCLELIEIRRRKSKIQSLGVTTAQLYVSDARRRRRRTHNTVTSIKKQPKTELGEGMSVRPAHARTHEHIPIHIDSRRIIISMR